MSEEPSSAGGSQRAGGRLPVLSDDEYARLLQRSIDSVTDGVFMCDEASLEFIYVNDGAVRMHGYSRTELLSGMTPVDLAPDLPREQLGSVLERLSVASAEGVRLRTTGMRKDGSPVPVEVEINWPDAAHPGAARPVIAIVRDMTEQFRAEAVLRRQQRLTAALSEIRLAMLRGASRQEGLTLVCETAAELLDATGALVLTPTGDRDEVAVESSAGVPREVIERMTFRTTVGAVGEVFQTGQPVHTPETRHPTMPPANREEVENRRVGPIMMAPLPVEDETVGVLAVVRLTGEDPFTEVDLDAAQQFAASAVMAIELAQARSNEAALELLADRERIGREMHDNVISRLFATGMKIQASTGRTTDPGLKQRLGGVVDDIDDAIKDIRTAIYGIRARTDWGKGVKGEVLRLAADQNASLGFEPNVHLDGPIDDLPERLVDALLAVIREALTNAAKYAKAKTVDLTVSCTSTGLTVEIEDNGIGFSPDTDDPAGHFSGNGLKNMADRASALGGTCTITSQPGAGATVRWSIPLPS